MTFGTRSHLRGLTEGRPRVVCSTALGETTGDGAGVAGTGEEPGDGAEDPYRNSSIRSFFVFSATTLK